MIELGSWLSARPRLRGLAWRASRRIYRAARGEPSENLIPLNGEAYLQHAAVKANIGRETFVAIDAGANEGEWTRSLLAALGSADAEIHAIEPVPMTLERFRGSVAPNGANQRIYTHQIALSDTIGQARMHVFSETGGTNSLHCETGARPDTNLVVTTQTLHAFCHEARIKFVHLAKFDLEGHDALALLGAREMLREQRIDLLQFEYNHRWIHARSFLKDVFDLIADLPYELARLVPDGVECLPRWHQELEKFFEANFVLIRRGALVRLNCRRGDFNGSNVYV